MTTDSLIECEQCHGEGEYFTDGECHECFACKPRKKRMTKNEPPNQKLIDRIRSFKFAYKQGDKLSDAHYQFNAGIETAINLIKGEPIGRDSAKGDSHLASGSSRLIGNEGSNPSSPANPCEISVVDEILIKKIRKLRDPKNIGLPDGLSSEDTLIFVLNWVEVIMRQHVPATEPVAGEPDNSIAARIEWSKQHSKTQQPVQLDKEGAAKFVYEAMQWAVRNAENGRHTPDWEKYGNSFAQEQSRKAVENILSVQPVREISFCGIKIVADSSLPEGRVHFVDATGKIVGRFITKIEGDKS